MKQRDFLACPVWFWAVLSGLWASGSLYAGPLIELRTSQGSFRGEKVAHDSEAVWLQETDGRLRMWPLSELQGFRRAGIEFRPASQADVRDRLRRELGQGFEVVGTGHYIVAGPPEQVRDYAETFEDLYRDFQTHFATRVGKLTEPRFPLVAIIFPNASRFREYAQQEGVRVVPGLRGYYSALSNRTVLFQDNRSVSARTRRNPGLLPAEKKLDLQLLPQSEEQDRSAWGTVEADLNSTMLHEATHQMAFNTGLHNRIGRNPQWVVEGLATVYEAPGMRSPALANIAGAKWNRERLAWFSEYVTRRPKDALTQFVSHDLLFQSAALDAYSEAWALTYFLVETRPALFGKYLRHIAARTPLQDYPADARLADFRSVFGEDLTLLDAAFLRFMAQQR